MYSALTCLALSVAALPPEVEGQLRQLLGAKGLHEYNEPALVVRGHDGLGIPLPPGPMEADVHVTGFMATTRLRYTFTNPTDVWMQATFVHPVPERGAVDVLRMHIGDRVIEGEVQEKSQAQRTFKRAKAAGKVAALATQLRPDLFSTSVANIPPRGSVSVELGIRQILGYQNEAFEYRLPIAVNPRFTPPGGISEPSARRLASLSDTQAASLESSIRVSLQAGLEVERIESPSHGLRTSVSKGTTLVHVNKAKLTGDFVLRWVPRLKDGPIAAAFTEELNGQTYGALMVLPPPAERVEKSSAPRELIFVIDTSGSMGGEAIVQARDALHNSLAQLRPTDSFEIVQFHSDVSTVFGRAVLASAENIEVANRAVSAMYADGGTMMHPALETAFSTPSSHGRRLRQVVFITDGAIGNGRGLHQMIRSGLKGARLFTVGIGSAPNARFMRKAAQAGRGSATFIANTSEVTSQMSGLFDRLSRPAATDFVVDWGRPAQTAIELVPDLYAGEPLFVFARLDGPASTVSVRGRTSLEAWQVGLRPQSIQASAAAGGLAKVWARRRIEALLDSTVLGESESMVRPEVLKLALEHQLVSPYTSFVAVDVTPQRPEGAPEGKGLVPSHLAKDRHQIAANLPNGGTGAQLWTLFGLLALALAAGLKMRGRVL